jgi:uncharacterized heparinase superfamily protein
MTRLRKLQGLPSRELVSLFRYKRSKAIQLLSHAVQMRFGRKGWPNTGVEGPAGLREDLRFFGVDGWRKRKEELKEILTQDLGVRLESIRATADQYCAHLFDVLGSGLLPLGETIDWHKDIKSGVTWEPVHFKRIKEIELTDDSDIKVPWELSRFHQFTALGKAYFLTNDEKYAAEFIRQWEHWMEKNPPYHGVNWHCAMEVAIRAINWIWGYYYFAQSAQFDQVRRAKFASALRIHGEYIHGNLEFNMRVIDGKFRRHNGNHYVADLVGLIYLGVVMPGRKTKGWLEFALSELEQELDAQVTADGVQWETTPSYHRFVLEMALSAVILCRDNDIAVAESVLKKLESMCEFTLHYLKPDGLCPLVRDADDGRLHWLNSDPFRDHRHILALGGAYLGRADMISRADGRWEDVLWLLGPEGVQRAREVKGRPPTLESKGFAESGFYVMRNRDKSHVFIVCGDIGMGGLQGGHSHNDCLSFELFYDGATFITDCGSYVYTGNPKERNAFRSTASHNTGRVDQCEMNRFEPDSLFHLENDAKPKVLQWLTRPEFDYLSCAHFGFTRLKSPVVHQRRFLLDRVSDYLIIEDCFQGEGEHLFEVFFHFSPDVRVDQRTDGGLSAQASASEIRLDLLRAENWRTRLDQGWVSESYGTKRPSCTLVATSRQSAPASLITAIRLPPGPVSAESEAAPDGRLKAALRQYRKVASGTPDESPLWK